MILLAILTMMNGNPSEPAAPEKQSAPSAVEKVCKDVLGRTVKCNPS